MNISISHGLVVRGIIMAGALLVATHGAWADSAFAVPTGERQLFLDDVGIAKIENLTRTMHQPAKKGAVIRPTPPLETSLQTGSSPQWDPSLKRFKLWMTTSTSIPRIAGTTYVESSDGLHWTKPILRQKEVGGSLENNYVTVDPKRGWPANAIMNVVYDPHDPDPSRRYKGLGNCTGREPMVSPDGIHWKLLDLPKLPSADESNMSYDIQTRTFIATLKCGGPYGRSHALSTSKDFEHWTKPELIFHADALDQKLGRENIKARLADPTLQQPGYNTPAVYNVDVYNMGVFRYGGLYIGMPAMYHAVGKAPEWRNTTGFHLIQLVCSRDMRNWMRLGDRRPFIGPSPLAAGAYDLTQMIGPSNAVVRGDELWFYYTACKYRGAPEGADPDQGAVCLAVLRRDGFISLDAGEAQGTIVTQPFKLPASKLFVNVEAFKGELRIEVVGESADVLAISEPMKGDLLRGEVTWQKGDLAVLKGKAVSLRFTLRNASLYSYWLQ